MSIGWSITLGYSSVHNEAEKAINLIVLQALAQSVPEHKSELVGRILSLRGDLNTDMVGEVFDTYALLGKTGCPIHMIEDGLHVMASGYGEYRDVKEVCHQVLAIWLMEEMLKDHIMIQVTIT